MKRLADHNYIHWAIRLAYKRGWFDQMEGKKQLLTEAIEAVAGFFFISRAVAIAKAYSDGIEAAMLFDSGKEHGAIDFPKEQWIKLLGDEKAYYEYVEIKAVEYADRKYSLAGVSDSEFSFPSIKIESAGGGFTYGFYHGSLKKGDVVECNTNYVRIQSVNGSSATGQPLGTFDKAKVRSLNVLKEDTVQDPTEESYLVEGGSSRDKILDGLVPTVEDELKRIIAERKTSKDKPKTKAKAKAKK